MNKIAYVVFELIKSARPLASLGAFLGCIASWGIAYHQISPVAFFSAFECFWSSCATMVINNYVDRQHDAMKDPPKDFALNNERLFLWFTIGFWAIEIMLICLYCLFDTRFILLAVIRAFVGFSYSWIRSVPLLPAMLVAGDLALCTVTPAVVYGTNSAMWMFLFSTIFAIYAREGGKDDCDYEADKIGKNKQTIATMFGPDVARIVSRCSLMAASLLLIAMPLTMLPKPAAWGGLVYLLVMSLAAFVFMNSVWWAQRLLDIGLGSFMLNVACAYWFLSMTSPIGDLRFSPIASFVIIILIVAHILCYTDKWVRCIETGIDHGLELSMKIKQSRLLWPAMYCLHWLIVFICRSIGRQIDGLSASLVEPAITATAATALLVLIVTARTPHIRTSGRSRGFTVVERYSAGLVLGFMAVVFHGLLWPIQVFAVIVTLMAILHPKLEVLCQLIRGHGCALGIFTAIAIVQGMQLVVSVFAVYIMLAAFYYLWYWRARRPVYIPDTGILSTAMRNCFVGESA